MNRSEEKTGRIGVSFEARPTAFELVVEEHVPELDPSSFGLVGKKFDPRSYFVTSGDAIFKTRAMIRDLEMYGYAFEPGEFSDSVLVCIGHAKRLLELLVLARGPHVFLETEHDDRRLWVIPKDPRKRGDCE